MAERASTGRVLTGAVGVVLMMAGAVIGVREVPSDQWWAVARWLVAGLVAHDVLIAPAAVVLGLVALRRAPASWQPAARAGLLALGTALLLLGCVLVAGTIRRNPTVLPFAAIASVVGAGAVSLAVPVAVGLWSARVTRNRTSERRGTPDPAPATPPPR